MNRFELLFVLVSLLVALALTNMVERAIPSIAATAGNSLLRRYRALTFLSFRLFYLNGDGEDPCRLVPYLRSTLVARKPAELTGGN